MSKNQTNPIEQWKDIKGYEGLYQVSNTGKVFSVRSGREMKQSLHRKGYKQVQLSNNGDGKRLYVHRLVLEAFKPQSVDQIGLHCDHIDEDKANNHIDNLRWVTSRFNTVRSKKFDYKVGVQKYTGRKGYPYMSSIKFKGKHIHLGKYKTKDEAHEAYNKGLQLVRQGIKPISPKPIPTTYNYGPRITYTKSKKNPVTLQIQYNKKPTHIGVYKTDEEAINAFKVGMDRISKGMHPRTPKNP